MSWRNTRDDWLAKFGLLPQADADPDGGAAPAWRRREEDSVGPGPQVSSKKCRPRRAAPI